jgi:peptidylprolyl isomerase
MIEAFAKLAIASCEVPASRRAPILYRVLALVLVLGPVWGYSEDRATPQGLGEAQKELSPEMSNFIHQFSRREGYRLAQEIHENGKWIDFQEVIEGIKDYASGEAAMASLKGDERSFDVAIQLFEAEAHKNLEDACVFLQKIAAKPTVHALENGKILYEVLQEGRETPSVQEGSSPRLQYTVWTLGGKEIVATRKGIGSHAVPLSETIPGFAKGVEGMREGERRILYIHPELGYALFGHFAPNSLLIVDVEVESIVVPEI